MNQPQTFKVFSIAGAFLVGIWIPLRLIGYIPQPQMEIFFDILCSLVAVANIQIYFSNHRNDFRKIQSWLNLSLALDMLCALPLSLLAFLLFDTTSSSLLLLNLLLIRHVSQIKNFLDFYDHFQPVTYRLVPLLIFLPLGLHLIACGWIALGSGNVGPTGDATFDYVRALYWSFSTLATVGYGDISAKSIPQMIYTCFVQVMGVGVFGYVVSNMTSLLSRKDAAREHHMDNLEKIENFMRSHEIPTDIRHRVRSYYQYLWKNKKGQQDQNILKSLPRKIQSELLLHINRPILEKVPILKDASPELVEDLMHHLEAHVYIPGEKIFRIGDEGEAMYFIYKGAIEISAPDKTIKALLHEGDFFGEMALLEDRKRTATARATQFCELYVLKKEDFNRAMTNYPEFLEHIHNVVMTRIP